MDILKEFSIIAYSFPYRDYRPGNIQKYFYFLLTKVERYFYDIICIIIKM